ncbi:MAG: carboxymuconolactone decarboxylase family protein [Actinomycetota bacterium]|nr:carboxymuconolactone decarboxylase family protein [Actinomycetota bacterium]
MAVVKLLETHNAPLLARPFFQDGDPGPIVRALAQTPELLQAAAPLLGTIFGPTSLDPRTKEVVVLRTSALAGCSFCTTGHSAAALDAGLRPAQVRALRGDGDLETAFEDDRDRELIRWVDEMAVGRSGIPEAVQSPIQGRFGDAGLVELALLSGVTLLLNRFSTALELPVSEDTVARLEIEGVL